MLLQRSKLVVFIIGLISFLGFTQANGQIYKAIIGDTEFLGQISFKDYSCGSPIVYVGFIGPYDNKYFQWSTNHGQSPPQYAKVYFTPKSTDTVTECCTFSIQYDLRNAPRGCPGGRTLKHCVTGYGISPDSLVLIRPRVLGYGVSIDKANKRYYGKFILNISNNTAATVTIRDILFNIDSLSGIKLLSVQDTNGNPILSIPPFAKNFPINFEVESRIGPLRASTTYQAAIDFLVSRLSVDSLYSNKVNLVLPGRTDSIIRPNKKAIHFSTSAGSIKRDSVTYSILDSVSNIHFDSLPYPFKITSVTKSDTLISAYVSCGPAVTGKYAANLKIKFTIVMFDGSITNDSLNIPVSAGIDTTRVSPSVVTFSGDAYSEYTRVIKFPTTGLEPTDSITISKLPYPFYIKVITKYLDTCLITIGCKGTGGSYIANQRIEYPITFYSEKRVQSMTFRCEAEISNENDTVFWEPKSFLPTGSTCVGVDPKGNIYSFSLKLSIISDSGKHVELRGNVPGVVRTFLHYDSLLFITVTYSGLGNPIELYRSSDTGMTWVRIIIDYIRNCPEYDYPVWVDHLFTGPNSEIFAMTSTPCAPLPYSDPLLYVWLYKSTDVGASWTRVGDNVWGIDSNYRFIQKWTPGRMSGHVSVNNYNFASDNLGVWRTSETLAGLYEANIMGLLPIFDSSIIAASNGRGVFVTDDYGVNWYGLNGGLPTKNIYSIVFNGERFWVGTDIGVYRSRQVKVRTAKVAAKASLSPLIIFPNPVNDKLEFQAPEELLLRCDIYNQLGKKLSSPSFTMNGDNIVIPQLSLRDGVYHLKVVTPTRSYFAKFMVLR